MKMVNKCTMSTVKYMWFLLHGVYWIFRQTYNYRHLCTTCSHVTRILYIVADFLQLQNLPHLTLATLHEHDALVHFVQAQVTDHLGSNNFHDVAGISSFSPYWNPLTSGLRNSAFPVLSWMSMQCIMWYALYRLRLMCGSMPSLVGWRIWSELDFEWWNISARNSVKFMASLCGFRTLIIYSSALLIVASERFGDLANCFKNFSGSAFKAAFLVPTLLVMSVPVRLWTAGSTLHNEGPWRWNNVWSGMNLVVSPNTSFDP